MDETRSWHRVTTIRVVAALGFFGMVNTGVFAPAAVVTNRIDGERGAPDTRSRSQAEADLVMRHLANKEYSQALEVAIKLTQANPDEPIGYNMQGVAYISTQDFAKARQNFESALRLQKDYEPALMNLAELDLRDKNFAGARRHYEAIMAKDANSLIAMLGMAKLEAMNQNEQERLAWLERAKAARPDAPAPRLLLATHYAGKKNYERAVAELRGAQRRLPSNPEILELLGQVQVASGKDADAVATYKRLVAVRPQSHVAYTRLAAAQAKVKDASAAANLRKALELKPDYPDALAGLAVVEGRAGRHAEALGLAQKVQKVAPTKASGFSLEGDVHLEQKRFSQAALAYEKALALEQIGGLAIKVHAAQTLAGNAKEADAKLQQWTREHPDDVIARLYVAQELAKSGKNQQAIEAYRAVLQKDPGNVLALNNLANIYYRESDPRAIGIAEEAYKQNPDSPAAVDTLGWILVERGQTARGLQLLQKAAAQAPKNAEIRYHLAAALAKSGEKARARRELEKLLATTQQFPQREAAQTLLRQL